MLFVNRFHDLLRELGGRCDAASDFNLLLNAYSEPHRAYHNAAHIADCLHQFDRAAFLAHRPDEVEFAIWFHDAVYDPRASDNEERSADWAKRALSEASVASDCIERIVVMILATKHDREPDSPDGELLLDIDLSILGREPEVFDAYDRAIRVEYNWVPAEQYRKGRAAVLERFLMREAIYRTRPFALRFEHQARKNLARCIEGLRRANG